MYHVEKPIKCFIMVFKCETISVAGEKERKIKRRNVPCGEEFKVQNNGNWELRI